jgi:nucleotide-binding universal stress UspA family protein
MDQHARAAPRGAPIVVGVGEHDGPVALTWAIALARALDVVVLAVHAFDPRIARPLIPSMAPPPPPAVAQDFYRKRQQLFEDTWCAELNAAEVCSRRLMVDGDAVDVLVDVAEREGASMVVVCSRGHRAVAELVQESVSHELIRRALCPVVVVPPPPEASRARARNQDEAHS